MAVGDAALQNTNHRVTCAHLRLDDWWSSFSTGQQRRFSSIVAFLHQFLLRHKHHHPRLVLDRRQRVFAAFRREVLLRAEQVAVVNNFQDVLRQVDHLELCLLHAMTAAANHKPRPVSVLDWFQLHRVLLQRFHDIVDLRRQMLSYVNHLTFGHVDERKHLTAEVDNIVKSLEKDALKLEPIEDGDRSGFVVRGSSHGVQRAKLQLVDLSMNILEVVFDAELLDTQKYFATKRGKDSLLAIENKSRVVVLVSEEERTEEGDDGKEATLLPGAKRTPPVIKSEVRVSNTMIRVLKGSVTDCHAEALIVTISEDFKHTDGAARLVAAAGGKEIEDQCQAIIKSGHKPLAAEAFVTTSGKLVTCSQLLYAVVRPWQGGHQQEGDLLFTAVWNALDMAAGMKLPTVAIAGVDWSFPASVACQNVVDAVADYQTQQYHFDSILLIDSRDQLVNHFHENLVKRFGKQNVKMDSGQSAGLPTEHVAAADWWSGAGDLKIVDCDDDDSDDNDEDDTAAGRRFKVVFHLYGSTRSDIDKVIKDIDELGKEAVTDRVLDTPENQAHIAKLTADQITHLQKIAERHQIKLTVEQGKRLNRIRLRGDANDITTVIAAVYQCFNQVDVNEHKKTEAELLAQQAHWEFLNPDGSFDSYPPEINLIIEKAFQAKKSTAEWTEHNDEEFVVDFSQNLEISKTSGQQIQVKRICDAAVPLPKDWDSNVTRSADIPSP